MTHPDDQIVDRLAEALLAKWKRKSEEEMASLPASVDPESLEPVSDTSHGERALEYTNALSPVVDAIARERAAEELEYFARDWQGWPARDMRATDLADVLARRAADLRDGTP